MFNLWKPLIPAGVQGTWAPVLQTDAAGNVVKEAWYFNGNFPWVGMLICAPIIGLWYWCTDQYIVQRALGAPNQAVARRTPLSERYPWVLWLVMLGVMAALALVLKRNVKSMPRR